VTNDQLRDDVLRNLDPLPVAVRHLFGGYGLYLEGTFFGVIADGRLFFHTDTESRAGYIEQGMTAFQPASRPRGPKTVDRNFEVPAEVQSDSRQLRAWAVRGVDRARRRPGEQR
jgi:DNA transformation protein